MLFSTKDSIILFAFDIISILRSIFSAIFWYAVSKFVETAPILDWSSSTTVFLGIRRRMGSEQFSDYSSVLTKTYTVVWGISCFPLLFHNIDLRWKKNWFWNSAIPDPLNFKTSSNALLSLSAMKVLHSDYDRSGNIEYPFCRPL